MAGSVGIGDNRPIDQAEQVCKELTQQADDEIAKLRQVLSEELPRFNELFSKKKVPGVLFDGKPLAK